MPTIRLTPRGFGPRFFSFSFGEAFENQDKLGTLEAVSFPRDQDLVTIT